MSGFRLYPLIISILICNFAFTQDIFKGYEHLFTAPLHYTAHLAGTSMQIDGKLDEKAWKKAAWTTYYTDIEGDKKPAPPYKTRCKMLWDTSNLYIAAELEDPHIWGTLTKHDQIIFHDNDFEVFIDSDNDTHAYFELEFNTLNTIFDLFMSKPYRNRGHLRTDWNANNIQSAIQIEGTLNNPGDTDKKWTIEIAIPFAALQMSGFVTSVPENNSIWRINFSRVQWDAEVVDGKYVKRKNPETGRVLPEHNWVWSPQGVINMHFPERWGYLQFVDVKAGKHVTAFALPPAEALKKYLWLLYYKQKSYSHKNSRYASSLEEIDLPTSIDEGENSCIFQLTATEHEFTATVTCNKSGMRWQIDHDGKITRLILAS